jgi:hypothetical protein
MAIMSELTLSKQQPRLQLALWTLGVLVAGAVVPGGGLVVALFAFFKALQDRTVAKWALLVIGLIMTFLALLVYLPGRESHFTGPPV